MRSMILMTTVVVGLLCGATPLHAAGASESAAGSERGSYLAGQGFIVPPDEVVIENYIASIDYDYPVPDDPIGVYVYTGNRTISPGGGPQILQIGVKGSKTEFAELPPMNLAFVIDNSGSMGSARKLDWVKQAFGVFVRKVRPTDFVSLVVFNSNAHTVFPSTRMRTSAVKERFLQAALDITAGGGTNLNEGLELGYREVQRNYRSDYINRVLFLTDGIGSSDRTLELAAMYRDLGINVSTIGVGDAFDLELMNAIAATGGGSSRFISNPEEMQNIFGDELDRMIVPAARNVHLRVTLSPGVQLDQTWGYRNRAEGNTIDYFMPTVHNWDYETILLRVECPQTEPGARFLIGTVEGQYETVDGRPAVIAPIEVAAVTASETDPLSGVSTYRVIQSNAMLEFAEALKQIGQVYYAGGSDGPVSPDGAMTALRLARAARANLLSARRRIDNIGFEKELGILDDYFVTLGANAKLSETDLLEITEDESLPIENAARTTIDHLTNLFQEVAGQLGHRGLTVAVAPFFIRTNVIYPDQFNDGMRGYIQNVSTTVLATDSGMELTDTDRIENELSTLGIGYDDLRDTVRALEVARRLGTDVIVTGNVLEMTDSFVVFARVIDGSSQEVLAAAQVVMNKEMVLDDLLGKSET